MPDALILGCSHAAGALMHEQPSLVLTEEPGKDQYQIEAEYGAKNSYPVKLAELLGYTPHNHAISGGSNDAMFRIFLEQADNFDLVIACWTGKDRGELFHTDHKYWIPINVGNSDSFTKTPNDSSATSAEPHGHHQALPQSPIPTPPRHQARDQSQSGPINCRR